MTSTFEPKDRKFDLKNAMKCVQLHLLGTLEEPAIRRGNFGRIYAYCNVSDPEDAKCAKKVLKILLIQKQGHAGDLFDIEREVFVFERLNKSGLSPRLFGHFQCGSYYFLLMERMKLDMLAVATYQAQGLESELRKIFEQQPQLPVDLIDTALRYSVVFTDEQLIRMFQIAQDLGRLYHVIHGDLKPDQFLYNEESLFQSKKIYVTDFGFAGLVDSAAKFKARIGFSGRKVGSGATNACDYFSQIPPDAVFQLKNSSSWLENYTRFYNSWQLAQAFLDTQRIYFIYGAKDGSWRELRFGTDLVAKASWPFYIQAAVRRRFEEGCPARPAPWDFYSNYFPLVNIPPF